MTTPIDAHFGRSVAQARRNQGLSQAALAEALSAAGLRMDAPAVSRMESGQRQLRLAEAAMVAQVLRVPLESLIVDSRERTPAQRLSLIRSEALASSFKSAEAVVQAATRFESVLTILRENPDLLPTLGEENQPGPSSADEYLRWEADEAYGQLTDLKIVARTDGPYFSDESVEVVLSVIRAMTSIEHDEVQRGERQATP